MVLRMMRGITITEVQSGQCTYVGCDLHYNRCWLNGGNDLPVLATQLGGGQDGVEFLQGAKLVPILVGIRSLNLYIALC